MAKNNTSFESGKSGNLKGRPRGIKDRRVLFREAFGKRAEDIIKSIIDAAIAGEPSAMRICADRLCPPIKPKEDPIQLSRFGKTPVEQADRVLQEMAAGNITPGEAQRVMECIKGRVSVIEITELMDRMERIEALLQERGISV